MEIKPICNDADYRTALKLVSALMKDDPELGTPDGDRLNILVTEIQAYEAKQYLNNPPQNE